MSTCRSFEDYLNHYRVCRGRVVVFLLLAAFADRRSLNDSGRPMEC
jgi:hypothetical protein